MTKKIWGLAWIFFADSNADGMITSSFSTLNGVWVLWGEELRMKNQSLLVPLIAYAIDISLW